MRASTPTNLTPVTRLGWSRLTVQQRLMLVTPPVLTFTMYAVFQLAVARLGFPIGWLVAFLVYWGVWCTLLPWFILGGWHGLLDLFRAPRASGKPTWTRVVLLGWPLVLPLVFRTMPALPQANLSIIVVSALIGIVIGVTEEILWRGTYIRLFPDHVGWGYLYPSVWFALWHIAPQAVVPSATATPGGMLAFLVYALLLGLSYGYDARQSASIRWCTVSHCLHDALGLSGFMFALWLR